LSDKPEDTGRASQGPSKEQATQDTDTASVSLQALLEQIPGPLRGVVENLLPQIVSFIDARIEAKLKELMPKLGEVTRQAIQDIIKQSLANVNPGQGQGPSPNPNPNPVQVSQDVQGPVQVLTQRDLIVAQLLQSILGRRGGLEEDLKRFAEIKQLAESISGGGLSPMEIFKVYRSGMLDTIKMLYLMTRKKFPLEKFLEEEEEEKEGESK